MPARIGIALGVLLFLSFVVAGRGLGASGAFAAAAGGALGRIAPNALAADPALADRMPTGSAALRELDRARDRRRLHRRRALGVARRALAASATRPLTATRVLRAGIGGALMGLGARLAYGCTSGLALSGGALLATGAWLFIPVTFATAMLVTLLARGRREEPVP